MDSGQALSDYLLAELERLAARPTREEMLARLRSRKPREAEDAGGRSRPRRARLGMIVVDASAVLEFLLQTARGRRVEARLFRNEDGADEAIADLTDLDLHVTRTSIYWPCVEARQPHCIRRDIRRPRRGDRCDDGDL